MICFLMPCSTGCGPLVPDTSSTATHSGLPMLDLPGDPLAMGTKSRETIYGASVRAAAERAAEARKHADRLAVEAWNKRMLGFQGPAQPSPTLGDALNAGYSYLEVRCLGCDTHQTVSLDIVRRPKATPIHELERYMRCRTARRCVAIHTSAAISSRCAPRRSRRAIRRRRVGQVSDDVGQLCLALWRKPENRCFPQRSHSASINHAAQELFGLTKTMMV
jgi:hypothetical protein